MHFTDSGPSDQAKVLGHSTSLDMLRDRLWVQTPQSRSRDICFEICTSPSNQRRDERVQSGAPWEEIQSLGLLSSKSQQALKNDSQRDLKPLPPPTRRRTQQGLCESHLQTKEAEEGMTLGLTELTVQNLVVSGVGNKAAAVLGPVQVGDKTGVALWGTQGAVRAGEGRTKDRGQN